MLQISIYIIMNDIYNKYALFEMWFQFMSIIAFYYNYMQYIKHW